MKIRGGNPEEYLFPNQTGGQLSETALAKYAHHNSAFAAADLRRLAASDMNSNVMNFVPAPT